MLAWDARALFDPGFQLSFLSVLAIAGIALPLLHKTPFVLDERPLLEATSPHAGLLSVSRVFRSLGLPQLIDANLDLRKRQACHGQKNQTRDHSQAHISSFAPSTRRCGTRSSSSPGQ